MLPLRRSGRGWNGLQIAADGNDRQLIALDRRGVSHFFPFESLGEFGLEGKNVLLWIGVPWSKKRVGDCFATFVFAFNNSSDAHFASDDIFLCKDSRAIELVGEHFKL